MEGNCTYIRLLCNGEKMCLAVVCGSQVFSQIILPTSLGFSDVIVLKNCPSISSISNMSVSHMNTTAELVTILIITC